ncbi:Uncharacterised protein [Mycobacteroides abscessus subsp. abscessus]|nr:Uncharacterised protein [Mycobacteroides abscessus subsp. abscessus]
MYRELLANFAHGGLCGVFAAIRLATGQHEPGTAALPYGQHRTVVVP